MSIELHMLMNLYDGDVRKLTKSQSANLLSQMKTIRDKNQFELSLVDELENAIKQPVSTK